MTSLRHPLDEGVLAQAELGEAVVPAIEPRKRRRQWLVFQSVDAPDPGIQMGILEITAPQASAGLLQGVETGRCSAAKGIDQR